MVTDLLAGKERLLDSGPAVPALLASAAIPAIYAPVEIDGVLYVDGGVADDTPITQALRLGADKIYVLPTGLSGRLERPPRDALEMAVDALNLLIHARLRQEIEEFRDKVIVLPPPERISVMPSDFSQADVLIKGGYASASWALDHLEPEGTPTDKAIERLKDPM